MVYKFNYKVVREPLEYDTFNVWCHGDYSMLCNILPGTHYVFLYEIINTNPSSIFAATNSSARQHPGKSKGVKGRATKHATWHERWHVECTPIWPHYFPHWRLYTTQRCFTAYCLKNRDSQRKPRPNCVKSTTYILKLIWCHVSAFAKGCKHLV